MAEFIKEKERIFVKDPSGKILAEITYPELLDGIYCIDHTFVDEALSGQGIAGKLVEAAVAEIEKKHGKVIATCPYAKKWLDKHGYVQDCMS